MFIFFSVQKQPLKVFWKERFQKFQKFHRKTVAGQLPPRKIAPNPKTNPKPNPNSNREGERGQFFSEAIVWLPPNPKANPDLTQTPILTGGNFSRVAIVQIPRKTPVLESLFIKKRLHRRSFPVKFAKLLRAPALKKIYNRLLLSIFSALLSLFFSNIYCFISLFLIF